MPLGRGVMYFDERETQCLAQYLLAESRQSPMDAGTDASALDVANQPDVPNEMDVPSGARDVPNAPRDVPNRDASDGARDVPSRDVSNGMAMDVVADGNS